MSDRCFACGKKKGKGYGLTWIIQQPHNMLKAVKHGWIKPNFFRKRRLEKLVHRISTDHTFSHPGVLHCPECLDIIRYGPKELREITKKARQELDRKWVIDMSNEIQADMAYKANIEKLRKKKGDDN